jgi:hypothetical protein
MRSICLFLTEALAVAELESPRRKTDHQKLEKGPFDERTEAYFGYNLLANNSSS